LGGSLGGALVLAGAFAFAFAGIPESESDVEFELGLELVLGDFVAGVGAAGCEQPLTATTPKTQETKATRI
jgi:hypothetical protein